MTSGSVSMDFDGMNARNIKSFANMNAFTGLSALNDETARIRDKKKESTRMFNEQYDFQRRQFIKKS